MKRRNVFLLSLLCFLFLCPRILQAQSDAKAREILDKTAAAFRQAQAVSITFGGTQEGTLLLKGNKFHLNTGDVETWFDGKTQWSYLRQNEEVNVSPPTPEELQSINPYVLLDHYSQHYNSRYSGVRTHSGKQGQEVILTPRASQQDIRSICFVVNNRYEPLYIRIDLKNGQQQEILIRTYRALQTASDKEFTFDSKKYPDAEIIDMR